MHPFFKLGTGAFALACAFLAAGSASAGVTYYSYSQVNPNDEPSVDNGGTGNLNSSAIYDANNFANSFITAGTSTMGAEASSTYFNSATTTTSINDSWSCSATSPCGLVPVGGIPIKLTFGINVSETQVTNDAFLQFVAQYQISGAGSFNFEFVQDGLGDFELTSQYVNAGGGAINVPVETSLKDGIYSLTVSSSVTDVLCSDDSCGVTYVATGGPLFTDQDYINAEAEGSGDPLDVINAEDPFSINVVSLDPNFQFTSDGGRSITSSGSAPVPEPSSLPMLLAGLGLIGGAFYFGRKKAKSI